MRQFKHNTSKSNDNQFSHFGLIEAMKHKKFNVLKSLNIIKTFWGFFQFGSLKIIFHNFEQNKVEKKLSNNHNNSKMRCSCHGFNKS